jgi:hypothetical protein
MARATSGNVHPYQLVGPDDAVDLGLVQPCLGRHVQQVPTAATSRGRGRGRGCTGEGLADALLARDDGGGGGRVGVGWVTSIECMRRGGGGTLNARPAGVGAVVDADAGVEIPVDSRSGGSGGGKGRVKTPRRPDGTLQRGAAAVVIAVCAAPPARPGAQGQPANAVEASTLFKCTRAQALHSLQGTLPATSQQAPTNTWLVPHSTLQPG